MSKKSDDPQPKPQDATAARERQRLIGRRLQSFFDDTIQEGVPEEFSKLLDQLDDAEKKRGEARAEEENAEPEAGRTGGRR
ncbi:MAG: NepR family anti-sigma factor [Oceanicaulis sp.]